MSGTSRGQVTITLGRGGQVVKRDGSLADSLPVAGTKRSVRDRLGNNVDKALLHGSLQNSNKRQRGDIGMSSLNSNGFDDMRVGKDDLRFKLMQKNAFRRAQSDEDQRHGDLREKLSKAVQHPVTGLDSRQRPVTGLDSRQQSVTGLDSRQRPVTGLDSRQRPVTGLDSRKRTVADLDSRQRTVADLDSRQRLPQLKETGFLGRIPSTRSADDLPQIDSMRNSYSPWTLDHLRRRSPDRVLVTSRGLSPQMNAEELQRRPLNRAFDDVRSVPFMSKDVVDATRPASTAAFMSNSTLPPGSAMPVAPHLSQLPPLSSIVQKSSYVGDEQQTVDGLLHTLGLGKYAIIFKAEEIDMTALKQMGENDLKELGIPMGPRKKILLALLPRSKRPPATNIR